MESLLSGKLQLKKADLTKHPLGYVVLSLVAAVASFVVIKFGIAGAIIISCLFVGLPLAYAVIAYPRFGIMTMLIASFFIMMLVKVNTNIPFGTLMDALELLLIIGFFLKHKYDRSWQFIHNPVTVLILVWIVYNILELFNPLAESRLAWLYTIRSVALVMMTYFVFMYYINTVNFIRLILKVWIGLSFFAALYAFKQEYFGFFPFEKNWLANDPVASGLYFIGGHWRKFSIFSDPVSSAYNMVIASLLCITLMFGPVSALKKTMLGILSVFFIMAMLYSGTRGAFVLIPAGLILLFVLKLNKKTLLIGVALVMIFLVVIKVPTSNATLSRFQSAFQPNHDASYNVRKINQKRIQPYIQSHPIGGGLGSTGTWGQRFSPNSYLASFPPDSGYVRVAVETGWIGLLLLGSLFFVVLLTGINNYFKIKDPELKNYCLAMIVIVFALNIGNFPQEALVQFPINIYFYLVIALINITLRLDRELTNKELTVQNIYHKQ
jgi:putative inorganic carbon (HCO3(-)) transporter